MESGPYNYSYRPKSRKYCSQIYEKSTAFQTGILEFKIQKKIVCTLWLS